MRRSRWAWLLILVCGVITPGSLYAQSPLTLEQALREARAANARLPVARLDTAIAGARIREARGRLWPNLQIEADAHGGAPTRFASGDGRLVMVGRVPLYDGGRLRSHVRVARARGAVAASGYRITERNLEFEVRFRFSELLEIRRELAFRRSGIEHLGRYVSLVEARMKSGEGLVGDLLRARVLLNQLTATLAETQRRLDEARLEFNELLGREPDEPVELVPLAPPGEPPTMGIRLWLAAPEIAQAEASRQVAREQVSVVRAGRRPHLDVEAVGGTQPILGSSFEAALNNGHGSGGEFTLSLSWPVFDAGVYRARLDQARLAYDQSEHALNATTRATRLAWNRARVDLVSAFQEVQIRGRNVPVARDARLQAESLYRGGAATSLEVLDAFSAWITANREKSRAIFRYRVAQAELKRWGTP